MWPPLPCKGPHISPCRTDDWGDADRFPVWQASLLLPWYRSGSPHWTESALSAAGFLSPFHGWDLTKTERTVTLTPTSLSGARVPALTQFPWWLLDQRHPIDALYDDFSSSGQFHSGCDTSVSLLAQKGRHLLKCKTTRITWKNAKVDAL